MKPAFGFVGLTDIQQICAEFEEACSQAAGTEELKGAIKTWWLHWKKAS